MFNIYFDRNSSYLDRDAELSLKELLPKIKSKTGYKITIVAHASKRASAKYNLWLSEKRLDKVSDWLTSNGVNGDAIKGEFKGESDPVYDCEECEEDKHRANRRATIIVTY